MLSVFQRHIKENRIRNVKCINKNWEEIVPFVDIDPHDVVIASFSLTMRDIQTALYKMVQLAKKGVCLFTFAGNPVWDYKILWPMIYGEEYDIGPDYMDLYNVLYSMGIHANIEISRKEHIQSFENLDNAVAFWKAKLGVASESAENVLRTYFNAKLIENDGNLYSGGHIESAMIWWNKQNH
jgi:hypothetical protein